ncbi:NAD(P)H-dependent flavin oxidoreductase [Thermodesulfobacteriota bacterium]
MQGNRLCRLLKIQYPIIQGGMAWASDWHLVAACSNAGILGTLGAGSMTLDEIRMNIEKLFEQTEMPFAINIPVLRPDAVDIGELSLEMGVKVFITAAGNPEKIVPVLKKDDVKIIHVVPSVKGAKKAVSAGVDGVVCEGYEAGGHNSPFEVTTLSLVPQVVDAVSVPVMAAGGIADGRGVAAVMALGADGAQLGTRFIATKECRCHENHKKLVVEADDTGTCIIGRKLNMLRVIRNEFAAKMEQAEKSGANAAELIEIIGSDIHRSKAASEKGDLTEGTFQAGQSAGLVADILTVNNLVKKLIAEYEAARQSLSPLGSSG